MKNASVCLITACSGKQSSGRVNAAASVMIFGEYLMHQSRSSKPCFKRAETDCGEYMVLSAALGGRFGGLWVHGIEFTTACCIGHIPCLWDLVISYGGGHGL